MKKLFICFLFLFANNLQAQTSYSKILAITTTVNPTVKTIKLKWNIIPSATGYTVSKKLRKSATWTTLDTLSTYSDTTYTDTVTNTQIGYEYQIVTTGSGVAASGCVYAAINLPANHYSGRIILLIDSTYINYCSAEIKQYLLDIVKEGWNYSLQFVSRATSVTGVKQIIKTIYEQDPANSKGVFILGHIAIPYSGIIYPDGHPDHEGAWPADCYYADTIFSRWTDSSVNITTASRPENKNVPGDGKFDQWGVNPNNIHLFVTRVDLINMPLINSNDSLLIKNYLVKDHAYRALQNRFRMRALVDDNIGYFAGEGFGQNGYRNGINLLSKDSVTDADYFTAMNTIDKSYLWSYGCGFGTYQSASGVGSTNDFQTKNVKSVFTMMFGSYFGDWDNSNNLLRASLASNSSVLTNCWAGRPNWFFHAMGLGECIGLTAYAQIKTPGIYTPSNYGSNFIHTELLGDPTLKMYLYDPPKNLLTANVNDTTVHLSWSASDDVNVTGYYVYRSASLSSQFALLNPNPVSTLNFTDNTPLIGKNIYMVRAVKLQNTISSGTFYNLSNGIIDSITVLRTLPIQLVYFTLNNKNCNVDLEWEMTNEQNVHHYEVLFSTDGIKYTFLRKLNASNASHYTTVHNQVCKFFEGKIIYYKLKITDANGGYVFSNAISVKLKTTTDISINENPVTEYITIKGLYEPGKIRIADVNGAVLYDHNVHTEKLTINASFLNSGIYFLQYFRKDNTSTLKFIKK